MLNESTAVVDPPLRVLVVGDSRRIDAVMDALATQFDSVSVFRERTPSSALARLEAVDVHCAVCAFDESDGESTVGRVRSRAESLPVVAVVDEHAAEGALESGATDVVTPDDPASVVAARVRTAAERERYRLAAESSVSKYRSILEGSNAPVWVVDAEGEITYASPAVESRLGVTTDELERRGTTRLVHPDDRDDAQDVLETVSSGPFGASERVTIRLRRADETWRVTDLHAVNRLEDPQVAGVVVTVTSTVPDRSPADDVRESLDRLEEPLFALGPRWELRYANDAATELFDGEPRPGTVVWDVLPETVRSTFAERLRETRTTDSPVVFETAHPKPERPLRVRAIPSERGIIVHARESVESDGPGETGATADRDRLALLESVVDALEDGILVLEDSTVTLANATSFELTGADALVGRGVDELFDDELAAAIRERGQSSVVRWMDPIPGNLVLGERRPVDVFVAPIPGDGRTLCVVRDRRRSPAGALSELEEAVASIRDADSRSNVRQTVADTALELTGAEFAGFYLVDEAALRPAAVATRDPSSTDLPSVDRSIVPLESIRDDGASIHDRRPLESFLSRSGVRAEQIVTVPVGANVLFATSTEPLAFDPIDLGPLETLAGIAAVALDELEYASLERERRRECASLEAALDRLRQLRSTERELLRATTREGIDRRLCEGVASLELDGGSVELAWIGDAASGGETIRSREAVGRGEAYLESVSISRDPSAGDPAGRTSATLETTVVEAIARGTDEPWRERALEQGFRSALSVPLVLDDFLYGTLTVYADEPNAFDERTRRAIEHLAAVGASAIGAIETRTALLSDDVTELELVLRDETEPLSSVAARLDRTLEVRSVVPRSSGGSVVFATVTADDPETIADALSGLEVVESVRPVGERADDALVELVLAESSIAAAVADHGGVVRSLTPTDDRVRLVAELSGTVDVRSFVRMLERRYPSTELVARRERERSPDDEHTFGAALRERLSERQRRTLEAAYYGGFFEWPRESTGEEIADSLDVSQPTFSRHVRIAQGKLFSLLFEEFDGLE
ncbi:MULTISPECIES: bacterio-opsin activator domain-containing protein [Natrialbaceae]|uniref:bacterio-opsin activator domain-containing protein n=1 Tax=Natrialbaceae TaxID=1644061 RepID=UPI00207C2BE7|nr:bacterio-opsin activator domain-containing protein [Natronococcus sp. CG52]